MKKEINIGDKLVAFEANAWTPFAYKKEFGRDITADICNIKTSDGGIDSIVLSRLAYIMAKAASPEIEGIEEWLCGFEMFDILNAQTEIIELWGLNNRQLSKPRKK